MLEVILFIIVCIILILFVILNNNRRCYKLALLLHFYDVHRIEPGFKINVSFFDSYYVNLYYHNKLIISNNKICKKGPWINMFLKLGQNKLNEVRKERKNIEIQTLNVLNKQFKEDFPNS